MAKKKKKTQHKYRKGEDLARISLELTGRSYMILRILQANGLTMDTLKDGAVLKWDK